VVAKNSFFPFGEAVPPFTAAGNTHWFTGHERDFVAQNDYMLARVYMFNSARFMSSDPQIRPFELSGQGGLYSYVKANPLRYSDPLGMATADCILMTGNIVWSVGASMVAVVGLFAPEPVVTKAVTWTAASSAAGAALSAYSNGRRCFNGMREEERRERQEEHDSQVIETCISSGKKGALDPQACHDALIACFLMARSGKRDHRCDEIEAISLHLFHEPPMPSPGVPPVLGPLM